MKKIAKYLLIAVTAVTAFACSKEVKVELTPSANVLVFSATLDTPTKATLDDYKTIWEVGDQIAVNNGTTWAVSSELAASDITDGGRSATFSVALDAGAVYYAVYPATSANIEASPAEWDAVSVTIPGVQNIPSGGCIAKDALVQVAKSEVEGKLSFKNVTSLVEFKIPEDGITAVYVDPYGAKGEALKVSGNIIVNTVNGSSTYGADSEIVKLTGSFTAGQTVFATVAPQEIVKTLRFVFGKDGAKAARTATATGDPFSLPLNGGKKIESFGTLNWLSNTITTKDQLLTWNTLSRYYDDPDETVTLGADIDMKGEVWNPVNGNANTAWHFWGDFDGADHSIYNITFNLDAEYVGFFSTLASNVLRERVKNLTLGREEDSSQLNLSGSATVGGALVGRLKNTKLSNITNYVKVSATKDGYSSCYLGGVVGRIMEDCDAALDKVKNFAQVSVDCNAQVAYAGGVVGLVSSPAVITSCENSGAVLFTKAVSGDKTTHCIGGVIGRLGNNAHGFVIDDCKNYGRVAPTVNLKCTQMYIGGILGMDGDYTGIEDAPTPPASPYTVATISNCRNEGSIESYNLTNDYQVGTGGIMGYMSGPSIVKDCVNVGAVTKMGNHATQAHLGGILGWLSNADGLVEGCVNGVQGDTSKGAVTDKKQTSNKNIRVGGIIGFGQRGKVSNCRNYAPVSYTDSGASKKEYVGGIVGNGTIINVYKCSNYGDVTSGGGASGDSAAGGIVGLQNGSSNASVQSGEDCVACCSVSCAVAGNAGAIVGRLGNSGGTVAVYGSEEHPVVIANGTKVNGNEVTADNFISYMAGSSYGITSVGVQFNNLNTIWAVFQP